jgi:hypothetical protein
MKPVESLPLKLAAVGTAVLFFVVAFALVGSSERPRIPAMPALAEQEDDPGALVRFEWLRLRNPETGVIPRDIRKRELEFASRLPSREALAKTGGFDAALAASWSSRGPSNIGGRTRALGVDVRNESIVLAGGVSGGMWRSSDGGSSWTKTTGYGDLHSVTCLAQDTRPAKGDIWYYGTGEYRGNSADGGGGGFYHGNGVYKSIDNGMSWTVLPVTNSGNELEWDQPFDYMWNLATDPSSAQDEVYAATGGGIQRSMDGGASWSTVLGGFTGSHSAYTDVAVTPGGAVYAALSDLNLSGAGGSLKRGLYRSTDGATWVDITPAAFPSAYERIVIEIAPSDPNVVYFLVANANGTDGVNQINRMQFWKYAYVSGNGAGSGGTWASRGENLPSESGPAASALINSLDNYAMVLCVKPNDPTFVVVGGSNLYASTDAFASAANWLRIGGYAGPTTSNFYSDHHPDQHAGVFLADNTTFLSGHDEGVGRTSDVTAGSVSWNKLSAGYITTQFYSIALDHATAGSPTVIGGMQDNGTWLTNSAVTSLPWVNALGGDGAATAIADGRTSYYASSQNGVAYRLILSAAGTLQDFTRISPAGASGYLFINPFILDPSDNTVMYLPAGSHLWMNSDLLGIPLWSVSPSTANDEKTQNWTDLTAAGVTGGTITALAASKAGPSHRLYYGTSNGRMYRLDNANTATASTNRMDVWSGKGFPSDAYVSGLAVDPSNGDRALAVFSNYGVASLFHTTNGGTTWTNVEGNLGGSSGPSCRAAAILPLGGTTVYLVGTSTGLYSTTTLNGSSTVWGREGSSTIGNVVVGALDARPLDGTVVAGSHGAGVFSAVFSPTGVEPGEVPARTALLQNYPNPFNPSTTIRFSLAAPAFVTLDVYAPDGRAVGTILSDHRDAGEHSAVWTPRGLASGTYLYRLRVEAASTGVRRESEREARTYTETRKLVYVK